MRPCDLLRRYAALPTLERRLARRAAVLLVLARLTLRWARPAQGLRWWRLVPPSAPVSSSPAPERVAWLVEAVASRLPFTTTCLARAAVSARLIAGTGHPCELVIGTDHAETGFAAHAWVVAGSGVAGPAPEPRFTPVARWTLPTLPTAMSGIAAIFHRDGAPAESAAITQLLARVRDRGPDGHAVSVEESIALGHALLATVPDDVAQPFEDGAGLAIVFDGRLDNGEELRAALNQRPDDGGDAALALAAYRRWGIDALPRLSGDFALIVRDLPARRLVAARDMLGMRPLCWHLTASTATCASTAGAVARHVGAAIDERTAADVLCGRPASATRTLYSGVLRLAPGHCLVIEPAGVSCAPYWTPDGVPALRYRSDDEYVEHLRHLLDTAVRARLRSPANRPVAIMLSGGLDSGAVCATASAIGGALDAYTLVSDDAALDESAAARATVARAGASTWTPVPATAAGFDFAGDTRRTGELPPYPTGAASHVLRRAVAASGRRVLLNGLGGDEWFFGSCADLADLLRRGDLRALARRWREERALPDPVTLGTQWQSTIWPLLPTPVKAVVRAVVPRRPPSWVEHAWARRVSAIEAVWPADGAPRSHAFAHLVANGWSPDLLAAREEQERCASWHGLDDRSPLHDRRIVEFALGLPEEARRLGRTPKGLLRRAMAGRLPEETLANVAYGDHAGLVVEALEALGSRALMARLTIAERGWVRPRAAVALHAELDAALEGGHARWPALAHQVWQVIAIELWHRGADGVDAGHAAP